MWIKNVFLLCVHFTSWNSRQPNTAASFTCLITHVLFFLCIAESYQQKPIMKPKFDCQMNIKNHETVLQDESCFMSSWFFFAWFKFVSSPSNSDICKG